MSDPNDSNALTVTFDTCALEAVVCPLTEDNVHATKAQRTVVRAAIQCGRIRGFFSESIITVEGIKGADRAEVLGQTRVLTEAFSSGEPQRGPSVTFQF